MKLTPTNITQFYSREEFKRDFVPFLSRLESALKEADKCINSVYPRSYTGNIYWFIVVLANIFYLDKVVHYAGLERNGQQKLDFSDVALDNLRFNKQYR